tara:strand:- start:5601 stop:6149 length:549 start_codon:yes stop_codon:yes gene_type:complete
MVLLNSSSCNFDWQPDNFQFSNLKGEKSLFYDFFNTNGLLVMFICNHCPYVRSIEKKIATEAQRLKILNVNSVAFMPNDQNAYKEDHNKFLLEQIYRANFKFDYVVDETQSIAKLFDAKCTPEFYYFNSYKKLKYRGRLDSNGKKSAMGNPELYSAVEEIIVKGYCSSQQHPSMGCSIKWKN